MVQFHIKKDGLPGRSFAQPGSCPLGGKHFESLNDAFAHAEQLNDAHFTEETEAGATAKRTDEEEASIVYWAYSSLPWRNRAESMSNYKKLQAENPEALEQIKSFMSLPVGSPSFNGLVKMAHSLSRVEV